MAEDSEHLVYTVLIMVDEEGLLQLVIQKCKNVILGTKTLDDVNKVDTNT